MPKPPNPKESGDRPLAPDERALLQRLMSHPMDLPPEFWAGLKGRLEVDTPSMLPSSIAGIRGEAWKEVGAGGMPAFANNWANLGGTEETAGFYKDALGIVHLKGLVTCAAGAGQGNQTVVFTLPDGYRPSKKWRFATRGASGLAAYSGFIWIYENGDVTVYLDGPGANVVVNDASLATCSFRIS